MSLVAISYPELKQNDFDLIENYRKANDELYHKVVGIHFTLVFPMNDMNVTEFKSEITNKIAETKSISFTLRCSTINKDAFSEYFYAFLVPDEGFSQIVKLHDRLYSDKLINYNRLDIDFIPHIGLGSSRDKLKVKRMVDEWNANEFSISGKINSIDIVNYENDTVISLEKIKLIDN